MTLLFVTQDFPPAIGGIQTYSRELARRLACLASDLEVVAPAHEEASALDRTGPFRVVRVPGRPDLLPVTGLPTVIRRAHALRADLAFHAQWQTVGASLLSRRLTGHPRRIVCAAHGRELLFNPASTIPGLGRAYDAFRRWCLRHVDVFVPVSRYTRNLLHEQGVSPARTHVVPNGTDPSAFRPHEATGLRERLGLSGRPLLLTVGRLVPRKGIDTVLRALPAVLQTVPDAAYLIVGSGPDRSRLEQLRADLGLHGHVYFEGRVSDEMLPAYYSTADLFVMPAREAVPDVEGFGIVFLEANACGTPVIGARTGGIPDAINEGETGLLVPPSAPDTLAQAIRPLLRAPRRIARFGRRARAHVVRDANWDRVAHQLWHVLSPEHDRAQP